MAPRRGFNLVDTYLAIYNIALFTGHYFLFVDVLNEIRHGTFKFSNHFFVFRLVTSLQILESVHSLLGWTKSNVKTGLIQLTGRLLMLYVLRDVHFSKGFLHRQLNPSTFLTVIYILSELARYPYYLTEVFNYPWKPLTWLRYNAFVVLYPLGFICEYACLIRYVVEGHISVHIPRGYGWTAMYWDILYGILLHTIFPAVCFRLYAHMCDQKERRGYYRGCLTGFRSTKSFRKIDQFLKKFF